MSSTGQKHGSCVHLMASFDGQSFCACCREKGKGSDPCVSHNDCNSCNILTEEQCLQLATPSYRLKKEKRELEKTSDTPIKDWDSSSLTDLSSVTVVGAVNAQGILQSPGSSSSTEQKKPNPTEKSKGHMSKHSKTGSEKPGKSPSIKPHRSSADARTDELYQKWSDRFNRLEAVLLSKTLDRPEPTFITVRMTPTHSPPVGAVRSTKPFIRPTDRSHVKICPTLTTLLRDRLINHRDQILLNRLQLQICLVVFRLFQRLSWPAHRPETKHLPTDLQI